MHLLHAQQHAHGPHPLLQQLYEQLSWCHETATGANSRSSTVQLCGTALAAQLRSTTIPQDHKRHAVCGCNGAPWVSDNRRRPWGDTLHVKRQARHTTDQALRIRSDRPDSHRDNTQPQGLHSFASVCGPITQASSSTSMWHLETVWHLNQMQGVAQASK